MRLLSLLSTASALTIPIPNLDDVQSKLCTYDGRAYTGFRVLRDRSIDIKTLKDTERATEIIECDQGKMLYSISLNQNQNESIFNTDLYPPPEFHKAIRISRRQVYQHKPGRYIPGTLVAAVYTRSITDEEYPTSEPSATPQSSNAGSEDKSEDEDCGCSLDCDCHDSEPDSDSDSEPDSNSDSNSDSDSDPEPLNEGENDPSDSQFQSQAQSQPQATPSIVEDTNPGFGSLYTPVSLLVADKWYQYTWKTELGKSPKATVLTSQFRSPDVLEKTYPKSDTWMQCFSPYEADDANPCTNVNYNNPNGIPGRPYLVYSQDVPKKLISNLKRIRHPRNKCKCNSRK